MLTREASPKKKKKSDTPEYKSFEHLRENTFEAVLHSVGIKYLNPNTHPSCKQHEKAQNTRLYTAGQQ
jgi:hypothetical protein